jgi:hypothetical protein
MTESGKEASKESPALKRPRGRPFGSVVSKSKRDVNAPECQAGSNVIARFQDGIYVYEQAYRRCGKGCSVCRSGGANFEPRRPGHGPYWYRLYKKDGKTFRKYIGRVLNSTTKALKEDD